MATPLHLVFFFSVIGCCFHGHFAFYTKLQTWLSLCAITITLSRAVIKLCLVSKAYSKWGKPFLLGLFKNLYFPWKSEYLKYKWSLISTSSIPCSSFLSFSQFTCCQGLIVFQHAIWVIMLLERTHANLFHNHLISIRSDFIVATRRALFFFKNQRLLFHMIFSTWLIEKLIIWKIHVVSTVYLEYCLSKFIGLIYSNMLNL